MKRRIRSILWALPLLLGGCRGALPTRSGVSGRPLAVWIDTDPSIGLKDKDVDDGLALVQAFHSPELEIRGVSAVFGNTDLEHSDPIAREVTTSFGPPGLPVYRGAAGAAQLGQETDASRALEAALEKERQTILALGPATNVATVVKNHPELAGRIVEIVAVAGRRPGQRFTTGTVNHKAHRDFNFEQDPEAFRVLLESRVPLTLAPFEISSKVWIEPDDLRLLSEGGASGRYLAEASRSWLALWQEVFKVGGFNPFDTLAVGYLVHPKLIRCEPLLAEIRTLPDDVTEERMQGAAPASKPYLLALPLAAGGRRVLYCHQADPSFKSELLRRLRSER